MNLKLLLQAVAIMQLSYLVWYSSGSSIIYVCTVAVLWCKQLHGLV